MMHFIFSTFSAILPRFPTWMEFEIWNEGSHQPRHATHTQTVEEKQFSSGQKLTTAWTHIWCMNERCTQLCAVPASALLINCVYAHIISIIFLSAWMCISLWMKEDSNNNGVFYSLVLFDQKLIFCRVNCQANCNRRTTITIKRNRTPNWVHPFGEFSTCSIEIFLLNNIKLSIVQTIISLTS